MNVDDSGRFILTKMVLCCTPATWKHGVVGGYDLRKSNLPEPISETKDVILVSFGRVCKFWSAQFQCWSIISLWLGGLWPKVESPLSRAFVTLGGRGGWRGALRVGNCWELINCLFKFIKNYFHLGKRTILLLKHVDKFGLQDQ